MHMFRGGFSRDIKNDCLKRSLSSLEYLRKVSKSSKRGLLNSVLK